MKWYNNFMKKYWLMKTEPSCFSIDDLKEEKQTAWSGVRNYQARNFMREMSLGDEVFIYHSSCAVPAIVGLGKVVTKAYPDKTQFDKKDDHYDPKSTKEKPIWDNVDIGYMKTFKEPITLSALKFRGDLSGMLVREQGSRLSVQPVSEKHFKSILENL